MDLVFFSLHFFFFFFFVLSLFSKEEVVSLFCSDLAIQVWVRGALI